MCVLLCYCLTQKQCLLKRKFPVWFFSALAGFIEPGQSFEDAIRREMWEEAGVVAWDIRYHSG
jgi:NAD+ diphosphatase